MPHRAVWIHGFLVAFAAATELEVEGDCFDAARMTYTGEKALRWLNMRLGPVTVAQELCTGDTDEGRAMPGVLRRAAPLVREVSGPKGKVLTLVDSAHFEKQMIEEMDAHDWRWIVGANQMSAVLERLVKQQPEGQWVDTGRDVQRGWAASQVCVFTHRLKGWRRPATIVARRWREVDDLPLPELWHYAFAGTNLEPSDLPKHVVKKYGFGPYVWMLYGMKQGHETHFKTALSDLGMHHPPSGRLGVDQAYATLMTAAANIAMVFRRRVASRPRTAACGCGASASATSKSQAR